MLIECDKTKNNELLELKQSFGLTLRVLATCCVRKADIFTDEHAASSLCPWQRLACLQRILKGIRITLCSGFL